MILNVSIAFAFENRLHFLVSLRGENSVPQVTTNATGTGSISLSEDLTELDYHITIEGLTPIEAHFHNGTFDETGPIVKALDFSNSFTISGTWSSNDLTDPLTSELVTELMAGRIYLNIRTADNPDGEIRGNANGFPGGVAILSGDNVIPPVTTDAKGTGVFAISGEQRQLLYSITVDGLTVSASHFHSYIMVVLYTVSQGVQ